MTTIIKAQVPPSSDGRKDPNDYRDDPGFLSALKPVEDIKHPQVEDEKDPFDWAEEFTLSEAEAKELSDSDFIYPNLIIRGHMAVFPAEPNAGKTTIMLWVAGQIATNHRVFYVNADVSGGDAKSMVTAAKQAGYTLLLPDMKVGGSMEMIVQKLAEMNATETDLSASVIFIDTLKKATDVISKGKAKAFYKILRGLTAKGMTVVLLAHTNKYKADDGQPIYEGTGDLRSDVDELIYLIPEKNPDGSLTVSTQPDKVRGKFKPITFEISPERKVKLADEYVDVAAIKTQKAREEADAFVIESITDAIRTGQHKQSDIFSFCKKRDIGRRTVQRVLRNYQYPPVQKWVCERRFQNNELNYRLVDSAPPDRCTNGQT